MADDTIDPAIVQQVEKEFRTLAKDTSRYRRNLGSTIETIAKGAKTRKIQNQIIKEYTRGLKEKLAAEKGETKASKEKIKLIEEEIKATEKLAGKFGIIGKALDWVKKIFFGLAAATLDTAKMLADAGQEVKGFSGLLKHFDENNLGILGAGFQKVAESLDFTTANFKTLAKQGADFGQNMVEMRAAAQAANMPLLQFVDLIQQNTEGFSRLFGTTNQGQVAIATLARSMRDFTKEEMARFGLNFEETNEYMATYLELMRSQGRAETMSTQQLVTGSQAYVKQLVRLARLTGQSTDELNRSMEQQKQNGVLQAALAKRAPEEARRLGELVQSLGGATSAYGGLAVDMIAAGAPMTEVSRKLAGANSDILNIISKAISDPSMDISAVVSDMRAASNQMLKDFPQAAAYFQGEFITMLDAAATYAGKKVGENIMPSKEFQTAQQAFTEAAVGWQETVDLTKTNIEAVGVAMYKLTAKDGTGAIDKFEEALLGVTGKAREYAEKGTEMLGGSNFSFDTASKALKVFVVNWWSKFKEKMSDKSTDAKGISYLWSEKFKEDLMNKFTDNKGLSSMWYKDPGDTEAENQEKNRQHGTYGATPGDTEAENQEKNRQHGTYGATGKMFENFGSSTPVNLHGVEAVVPKNTAFGKALAMLETIKNTKKSVETITTSFGTDKKVADDTSVNNNLALVEGVHRMVTTNEKLGDILNKLVTVGMMTEKNTKSTSKSVENMSGTLV